LREDSTTTAQAFSPDLRISASTRSLLVAGLDGAIAALSLWLAYKLRFDVPVETTRDLLALVGALVAARIAANLYFRLHRWSFKLSNLADGARIGLAGAFGSMGFVGLTYFLLRPHYGIDLPARGVVVLELLLSTFLMTAVRFAPRLLWMYSADLKRGRPGGGAVRTLIVGAGKAGEMLLRDLQRNSDHDWHVVGFVDDNPAKWGHIVGGRPILGSIDSLASFVQQMRARHVVLAIPRLPASRVREILSLGFHQKVQFHILPATYGAVQERDFSELLREVSPDDLLERAPVSFDALEGSSSFEPNRLALVAGAAGSIGREISQQLLQLNCNRLVMVDTNENELYVLKRRYERLFPHAEVIAEVADIRDRARLEGLFAAYRPRDVFHAAARKHVPLMESAPCEAVKTNVVGTLNLAEAAKSFGVERFVFTSTDKAVRPTSVMGATKRLGEQLLRQMAAGSKTRFFVVRFGNVLDSAGSVVPLFREQIAAGGPITVTHPEIQRYFMTISEAVALVLRAAYGDHGPLCVLEMGEPIKILDLARQMITMAGLVPEVDIRIEFTGLRPGEKLFEELVGDGEKVVRVIDRKIKVVEGVTPPVGLRARIEELRLAAAEEDSRTVRSLLHQLVPEYRALPGPYSRERSLQAPQAVM
jgi:FlaA1/EpsC-like NDP-sugar epimerase